MAKGYAMESWRGKKGSNVFYRIANSSNAQKQGIRERNYEVSNPKTSAQAEQRMKVRAAANFYRQLSLILNRGVANLPYGQLTRNEFMSAALKLNVTDIPAIHKNDIKAVPGRYLLSKGALPAVIIDYIDEDGNATINTDLIYAVEGWQGGQITQALFNSMTETGVLKEGDQFTIVKVSEYGAFSVHSFVVKVGETIPSVLQKAPDNTNFYIPNCCAAAIIISRKVGNGYQRSTSRMVVNKEILNHNMGLYYGEDAVTAALQSYMKSASTSSDVDWPVDNGGGDFTTSQNFESTYTLSGLTGVLTAFNGATIRVLRSAETGELSGVYVRNTTEGLAVVDAATNSALYRANEPAYLTPNNVPALANLTKYNLDSSL